MPRPRRVWDSCIVIGYLAGYEELRSDCPNIIEEARQGRLEIVISVWATIEAAYLHGHSDSDSEGKIEEFFSRDYVIPVAIDTPNAAIARGLVRRHRNLSPADAVHLAVAIQLHILILETTDPDLLGLSETEGNPPVVIRRPLHEGPRRLPF